RVPGAIGAVAVKLRRGFLHDFGASAARAFAVRIEILAARQLNMHRLGVLSAHGLRTLVIGAPFIADHHDTLAVLHLGVGDVVVLIEDHHQRLEAERLFQPAKRGFRIEVADRARQALRAIEIGHAGIPLRYQEYFYYSATIESNETGHPCERPISRSQLDQFSV